MKKLLLSCVIGLALAIGVQAEDEGKEQTIKGKAMCGKCELKKTSSCQNVIKTKDGDKEVVYFLDQNDVSKKFHKNVCSSTQDVVATGKVKKDGDKMVLVASKIELAKKDQ